MKKILIQFFSAASVFLLAFNIAQAEQVVDEGDYLVHYNAFDSTFLQPGVAKNFNITRSRVRGVVSISVQRKQGDGFPESHPATVTGEAINLSSQVKHLEFTEVTEGNIVYYLSTFPFKDKEVLRFEISVVPDGRTRATDISFKKQFFVD